MTLYTMTECRRSSGSDDIVTWRQALRDNQPIFLLYQGGICLGINYYSPALDVLPRPCSWTFCSDYITL